MDLGRVLELLTALKIGQVAQKASYCALVPISNIFLCRCCYPLEARRFPYRSLLGNGQTCNRINDWWWAYENANDSPLQCYYILLSPLILMNVYMLLFKDYHKKGSFHKIMLLSQMVLRVIVLMGLSFCRVSSTLPPLQQQISSSHI